MTTSVLATAFGPNYELEGEVGRGGMATVYQARDLRHGRRVAIKVLHPSIAAALGAERFRREIRIAAGLQHPHILPVFDSGRVVTTDGRPLLWYAMPFVEGESLRDLLDREGALPLVGALRIAREVAEALDYAHRHGVVHRDIKPENILLLDGQAVVADFGIARPMTPPPEGGAGLTHEGVVVGTPAYVSPEQGLGSSTLDGRSDLYSLGCVLFEMLTGTTLFGGRTPEAIIEQRYAEPAHLFDRLPATVPPRVRSVLARLLARLPADRYETGAQVAAALAEERMSSPVAAFEVERMVPPVRPGGRATVFGLLLVAVSAAALVVALRLRLHPVAPLAQDEAALPPRIAVLPFRNLGTGGDYFADGLTEEVTSRLGTVRGLSVISRTSTLHYRQSERTVRQIGGELSAAYILEGSVRWEGRQGGAGSVRVIARLVRVADDTQLWGDSYDADLADVFRVQANIAEAVAAALDVHLGGEDRAVLAQSLTRSVEAYDAFLRANLYTDRGWSDLEAVDSATDYYRLAITYDSGFADAWARLSIAQTMRFRRAPVGRESLLVEAKAAADTALRLDPELGTGHLAMGYYHYWGKRDYDRARAEFTAALRRRPSDGDALYGLGAVSRRQGRWTEAVASLCGAADLDPRSASKAWDCGLARFFTRDYPAAERYFDRSIMLDPSNAFAYTSKARVRLAWQGDVDGASDILSRARGKVELGTLASGINDATFLLTDSSWTKELERLTMRNFEDNPIDYYAWKGLWYRARGDKGRELAVWDSLRVAATRIARERPGFDEPWVGLAIAYSGLGRVAETRDAIARAEAALPLSRDHAWGADRAVYFAQCYAWLGETDSAAAVLERLLTMPSPLSPARLRVDPAYDRIRDDTRMRRLWD